MDLNQHKLGEENGFDRLEHKSEEADTEPGETYFVSKLFCVHSVILDFDKFMAYLDD